MELARIYNQRNSSWNVPYTFSGKEKDVETGYGYFGARYYDSGLSIWLSVDPMSDKYPSMSPYNYCANNPIILVDPDGREIYILGLFEPNGFCPEKFKDGRDVDLATKMVFNACLNLYNGSEWGKAVISALTGQGSPTVNINFGKVKKNSGGHTTETSKGSDITIDENCKNLSFSIIISVVHELFHAYQNAKGVKGRSIFKEVEANIFSQITVGFSYLESECTDAFGNEYNNDVKKIDSGLNQDLIDKLTDDFQSCSQANSLGIYNDYPIRNKTNQKSLLLLLPANNN